MLIPELLQAKIDLSGEGFLPKASSRIQAFRDYLKIYWKVIVRSLFHRIKSRDVKGTRNKIEAWLDYWPEVYGPCEPPIGMYPLVTKSCSTRAHSLIIRKTLQPPFLMIS